MKKIHSVFFASLVLVSSVCFAFEDHDSFICRLLQDKANQTLKTLEPVLDWEQFFKNKTIVGEGFEEMYTSYTTEVKNKNIAIGQHNSDIQLAAIIHQDRCGGINYQNIENEYFYEGSDKHPEPGE